MIIISEKRWLFDKDYQIAIFFSVISNEPVDKHGTLTVGVPKVSMVKSLTPDYTDQELYALTAAAEKNSEHPLGKAIVNCFRRENNGELMTADAFEMKPGQGVCAVVSGKEVLAGNEKLMTAAGVTVDNSVKAQMETELLKGCTVTLVAVNGKLVGLLALSDSLRKESKSVIHGLQRLGVTPVLLTGDNEYSAGQIAGQIGIRDVRANCLPEDKLNFIDAYQKQEELVCMIGDGVNDAPALKKAMIGIAMGGVESDIAVDAADIALVDDEIKELPHLFALSGKIMNKIKFNLSFSMLLNFVAIILAMTGILNPVVGALVHNCGSVFVIINSAFLMSYTYRNI